MPVWLIGLLVFIGVVMLCSVIYLPALQLNLDSYGVRIRPRKKIPEVESEQPRESALLKLCQTVGEQVLKHFPNLADDKSKTYLMHANYRTQQHLQVLIGIKSFMTGGTVLLLLLGSSGNPLMLVAVLPACFVTWTMPNFFLSGRVKKRQDAIVNELPTVIDLMIVCAQAGLGLLMCIDKVRKEIHGTCPNLATELEQMINDVKVFAKSVPIALKDMGERCGVEEISTMSGALISAESKGSDISYPLRQQASALRDRLKRKREEEAAKVPVKMVPVIMVFVMPLILAPMLGPAVITILQAMGPMMGGK